MVQVNHEIEQIVPIVTLFHESWGNTTHVLGDIILYTKALHSQIIITTTGEPPMVGMYCSEKVPSANRTLRLVLPTDSRPTRSLTTKLSTWRNNGHRHSL